MEFCRGAKVTDKAYLEKHGVDGNEVMILVCVGVSLMPCPLQVMGKLGKLFSEMIFQHGFVHCDPHPGNILVCCDPPGSPANSKLQIVILDHGLYSVSGCLL